MAFPRVIMEILMKIMAVLAIQKQRLKGLFEPHKEFPHWRCSRSPGKSNSA